MKIKKLIIIFIITVISLLLYGISYLLYKSDLIAYSENKKYRIELRKINTVSSDYICNLILKNKIERLVKTKKIILPCINSYEININDNGYFYLKVISHISAISGISPRFIFYNNELKELKNIETSFFIDGKFGSPNKFYFINMSEQANQKGLNIYSLDEFDFISGNLLNINDKIQLESYKEIKLSIDGDFLNVKQLNGDTILFNKKIR